MANPGLSCPDQCRLYLSQNASILIGVVFFTGLVINAEQLNEVR